MFVTSFFNLFEVKFISKDSFRLFFELLMSLSELFFSLFFLLFLELFPSNLISLSLNIESCFIVQDIIFNFGLSFLIKFPFLSKLLLSKCIISIFFNLTLNNSFFTDNGDGTGQFAGP